MLLPTILPIFFLLATQVTAFDVLGTMYRGRIGAAGTDLTKYPTKVTVGKKEVPVYPVAVYSDRVGSLKYNVLKLTNKKNGKSAYAHVTDECADGDCLQNKNIARKRGDVLVDIHSSMWDALNLDSFGIHDLRGSVVTRKRYTYKNSAGIRRVTTKDGLRGYVPNKWKVG